MKRTITLLAGAALLAAAGAAAAQDPEPRSSSDAEVTRDQIVERIDRRFDRLDVNDDGRFTPDEIGAAREQRREQAAGRLFERLDADRNGAISRDEFAQARAARAEHRRGPGMRAMRGMRMRMGLRRGMRMFAERGFVTAEQLRERALARFDRLDADRNGVLTAAERRQARGLRFHRGGPAMRDSRDDE